jgi:predicted XRE-type DNA-binding protein
MATKKNPVKKFPSAATLKKVRDKLSDPEYRGGNIALPDDASEVERAKYKLCQLIAKYHREHELTQRQLAKKLDIDEARISEILRGKISSFTVDRLLGYAQKVFPHVKIEILAA